MMGSGLSEAVKAAGHVLQVKVEDQKTRIDGGLPIAEDLHCLEDAEAERRG